MNKAKNYMYYILIGIVSTIAVVVLPMIGSDVGLEIQLPDTVSGWIVYVGTALFNALGNMMIFFGFMEQAKLNVKNEEHYVEANKILLELQLKRANKKALPRSPRKWNAGEYSRKGVMLFLGSIFSCVALTNALLRFDLIVLVSYAISVTFAIVFGIFQMKTAEEYWTNEYYRYAMYEKGLEETKEKEKEVTKPLEVQTDKLEVKIND